MVNYSNNIFMELVLSKVTDETSETDVLKSVMSFLCYPHFYNCFNLQYGM